MIERFKNRMPATYEIKCYIIILIYSITKQYKYKMTER